MRASRFLRVAVAAGCLVMLGSSATVAAPPSAERIIVNDIGVVEEGLTEACGVDVWLDVVGHITFRVFVDGDDNATGEVNNYALRARFYSDFGAYNIVDVGADRVEYLDDGSLILTVIGNVQSFQAKGQGRVYSDVGRVSFHVTFDADGNPILELLSAGGQHDEDSTEAACAILAP